MRLGSRLRRDGEAAGEAAGEAVGEAVGEGLGGDGLDAADAATGSVKGLAAVFSALRLGSAPMTVVLSLIILVAWSISLLVAPPVMAMAPGRLGGILVGTGLWIAALVAGVMAASLLVRPLAPLFATHRAAGKEQLIGRVCMIKTGTVDERGGQALFSRDGDEILIAVRCERPNTLSRGSMAVIVDWLRDEDVFLVTAADDIVRGEVAGSSI